MVQRRTSARPFSNPARTRPPVRVAVTEHDATRPFPTGYQPVVIELPEGTVARYRAAREVAAAGVGLVHTPARHARTAIRLARRANLPVVVTFDGADVADVAAWGLHRDRVFALAHVCVATSPYVADRLVALGCRRDRIRTVPIGVDCDALTPDGSPRERGLVTVGPLVERTGILPLLKALTLIRSRTGSCPPLTIAGTGEQRALLDTMVRRLQLDVRFADRPSVDLLHRFTALVVPAQSMIDGDSEGVPFAVHEARAAGMPVIVTDVDGVADAVQQNVDGLVVPSRDPHALSLAIERLLGDVELQETLRQGGFDAARAVDTSVEAIELEILYDGVLDSDD